MRRNRKIGTRSLLDFEPNKKRKKKELNFEQL